MTRAYQCANVPGPHLGKVGTPASVTSAIKRAERPILIVGSELANLNWALTLAKEQNIPIVATAHVAGTIAEMGANPDRVLGAIEITNLLKSPEWSGIRGEGQHDLAIFVDVLYYLEAQMLSALKHFAPHIKTISLTKGHQPNANQSLPNLSKKKLGEFLAEVAEGLAK
ncbi:MAG: CO dehydrogenase/acetyl-CoA synthase complex subunit epsilon [Methanosarcinales archaeon]|nr:MAG: CO dehydrogenase/acetyl-CoA synthase complex subunit epsilon [Methanosarcinales archaeon]